MATKTWTISGMLTLIASGLAIAATWGGAWDDFGWITPAKYQADYAETMGEIREFRDEWKCDEWDEELLELKRALADPALSDAERVEIEHEVEKLKEKMAKIDCSRFED